MRHLVCGLLQRTEFLAAVAPIAPTRPEQQQAEALAAVFQWGGEPASPRQSPYMCTV